MLHGHLPNWNCLEFTQLAVEAGHFESFGMFGAIESCEFTCVVCTSNSCSEIGVWHVWWLVAWRMGELPMRPESVMFPRLLDIQGSFWNFDNVWQKQRRSAEQGLKRRLECNRMRRKYCTLYALKLFDNGQTNFYHSYGLQSLATYDL